ncbi:hypothetical protein CPB86DRAFT_821459, partial [Serendipita vermifera]
MWVETKSTGRRRLYESMGSSLLFNGTGNSHLVAGRDDKVDVKALDEPHRSRVVIPQLALQPHHPIYNLNESSTPNTSTLNTDQNVLRLQFPQRRASVSLPMLLRTDPIQATKENAADMTTMEETSREVDMGGTPTAGPRPGHIHPEGTTLKIQIEIVHRTHNKIDISKCPTMGETSAEEGSGETYVGLGNRGGDDERRTSDAYGGEGLTETHHGRNYRDNDYNGNVNNRNNYGGSDNRGNTSHVDPNAGTYVAGSGDKWKP